MITDYAVIRKQGKKEGAEKLFQAGAGGRGGEAVLGETPSISVAELQRAGLFSEYGGGVPNVVQTRSGSYNFASAGLGRSLHARAMMSTGSSSYSRRH